LDDIKKNNKRIIIALEGIDGAGKTTLINSIFNELDGEVSIYRRTQKGILMDKFLSSRFMAKYRVFQIPFYFLLSYINYLRFCCKKQYDVVIMDRCFLSNICYYFPSALYDEKN
jgi:thymidylate kinase